MNTLAQLFESGLKLIHDQKLTKDNFKLMVRKSLRQNGGAKYFEESVLSSHTTRIRAVYIYLGSAQSGFEQLVCCPFSSIFFFFFLRLTTVNLA